MRTVLVTLAVALLLAGPGCIMPDQVNELHEDVTDLQRKLQTIEQQQSRSAEQIAALLEEIRSQERQEQAISRTDFAEVRSTLGDIARGQGMTTEQIGEANRRMDMLSQNIQENRELIRQLNTNSTLIATPSGIDSQTGAAAATPGALPDAGDLYNSAYADFSKGNFALAISGFEEYAARYSESDRADNALYWVGECYFGQGDLGAAVQALDRMLEQYPQSEKAAAANLKKGLAYMERNQIREAIIQLRFVEDRYPGTDEARIAEDRLNSLGAPSKPS